MRVGGEAVATLREGDCFGEVAALDWSAGFARPRSATVAVAATALARTPAELTAANVAAGWIGAPRDCSASSASRRPGRPSCTAAAGTVRAASSGRSRAKSGRAAPTSSPRPMYRLVRDGHVDPARYASARARPSRAGAPGGMTSVELLQAVRLVAERLELVGADVVEVIPTAVGSADVTALVAERIVREILTGVALRRGHAA